MYSSFNEYKYRNNGNTSEAFAFAWHFSTSKLSSTNLDDSEVLYGELPDDLQMAHQPHFVCAAVLHLTALNPEKHIVWQILAKQNSVPKTVNFKPCKQ